MRQKQIPAPLKTKAFLHKKGLVAFPQELSHMPKQQCYISYKQSLIILSGINQKLVNNMIVKISSFKVKHTSASIGVASSLF